MHEHVPLRRSVVAVGLGVLLAACGGGGGGDDDGDTGPTRAPVTTTTLPPDVVISQLPAEGCALVDDETVAAYGVDPATATESERTSNPTLGLVDLRGCRWGVPTDDPTAAPSHELELMITQFSDDATAANEALGMGTARRAGAPVAPDMVAGDETYAQDLGDDYRAGGIVWVRAGRVVVMVRSTGGGPPLAARIADAGNVQALIESLAAGESELPE